MTKPRIMEGICEYCGVPADTCPHFRSGAYVSNVKKDDRKVDLYKKLSNRERIADIIIPHHNRHDHLHECLNRLPNDIFNIIIVSGGSFAYNCNKGARLAETDNIIILNDDTLPDPEMFVEACNMKEDIVGFSQIIPSNGEEVLHGIGFYVEDGKWKAAATGNLSTIKIPSGFAFRIKRSVWEDLGGFDEGFYNGGEDSDLFFSAIEKGYSISMGQLKPIIHKHSQSDGRLTFSKENQQLLDEKWPNDKVISLLNLENDIKKLRILLANNHLDNFAGSETWTYTMAKQFEKMGHEVSVYTRGKGKVSEMLNTVEIPEDEYDLLIINHNTCLRDLEHVKGYKIFTSHGIYPALEQPIEGADAYVAISPEVQGHLKRKGFESRLIYNGVDMERFAPVYPINHRLTKVLSLCKGDEANEIIKEACQYLDIEFSYCEGKFDVENNINEADLVITLGRGAVEAMSCGRDVLIFDSRSYMKMGCVGDGIIRPDNVTHIMAHNYSGRAKNTNFDVYSLAREMKKYDSSKAELNRRHVKTFHDVAVAANRYLNLYDNRNSKS
jgi:hypothetical protein